MQPTLALGQIVVTAGAAILLQEARQEATEFLSRHEQGDWGDLSAYEKEAFDQGLAEGSRAIFISAYPLKTGQTIWVVTNLHQGTTTVLLPHEQAR